jgi:hypothetical protein
MPREPVRKPAKDIMVCHVLIPYSTTLAAQVMLTGQIGVTISD